ncbi:flagellar hook-length control protein [Thermotoga maritima MSB8]|uniref:Flagellar hook-length control protein-like C-terminal domain-containing protein n=1 Tax=Thermotoga maritima (strain ATCC 43589 / DSM 3109 / JCM 10099 / NBRC 100826 / MSB8) TaxID=243274 RepID=Q9WZE0_THEMA|nr:flagellar hook-length control protein FliK [Thermotoga maritima]AAD35756.1 hypothetical protein TM_0672 [Thermotoga maritima MSB8]AGL49597.1 hypothetical protein Tmari_0672 [Thermotoga maritima MSB8]AHD17574.1 flagellar hook-length control protein [Thermotoga maritima MSB8]AKE26592.1 flagellar hook-length control protein [Thermotoga maritima]AKE28457.1 flagellar hook-length control protein [Thermotoga maritima MSB8]
MKVGQFSLFAMIKTAEEKGELKKKSAAGLFSQSVKDLMKSLGSKGKVLGTTPGKKNVHRAESSENRADGLKKTKRNVLDNLDGTSAQHISMSAEENVKLEEMLGGQLSEKPQNVSEDQKEREEEAGRSSSSKLIKEIKTTDDKSSEKHVLEEVSKRDENHAEYRKSEQGIFKSRTHDISTEKLLTSTEHEEKKENGFLVKDSENKESASQISFEKKHSSIPYLESETSRSESNKKLSSSFRTPAEPSLKSESTKVFKEQPISAQDKETKHSARQPIFNETRSLPQNSDAAKLSRDFEKTTGIKNELFEERITGNTGNEIKMSKLSFVPLLPADEKQQSSNGDGERVLEVINQRISQINFGNSGLKESLLVNENSENSKENQKINSFTKRGDTHTEEQLEKTSSSLRETVLSIRNDGSSPEKNTRSVLNSRNEAPSVRRKTPANKFDGQKVVENNSKVSPEKTSEKPLFQNREKNQPMEMKMKYEEKGKIESYREITNREALEFLSQERAKQVYSLPELKRTETVHLPRFVEQMYYHKTERAVIDLEPPELGKLEITITKEENQLKIVFRVQTEEAKHVLEHDIPRLIERFNEKGFDVQVYVEKQEEDYLYQENQNKEGNQRQQRESKNHKRETSGSLFEEFIQEVKT